jgi:hypothetical protein
MRRLLLYQTVVCIGKVMNITMAMLSDETEKRNERKPV